MFCENCGKPMNDTAKFCGQCGHKVSHIPNAAPVAPVVAEPVAPVAQEPVAPVVSDPVVPVVQEPIAPVEPELVAPVVQEPVAPVMPEPVQPVYQEQPTYQPQPQYQYQEQPQYQYQPQYQPQPYAYQPEQKSGKKKTVLIIAAVVAALAIIGVLLWIFVFSGNELEGTKWLGEENTIVFTDDKNGYLEFDDFYDGESYKQHFTYTIDEGELTLHPKDPELAGQDLEFDYKISGDQLILVSDEYGEKFVYHNADKAFTCEYCHEVQTGQKYTGALDGYSYSFCQDCWEEVEFWLD